MKKKQKELEEKKELALQKEKKIEKTKETGSEAALYTGFC